MRRHLSRYAKWFVGVGVLTLLACEGAVGPNTILSAKGKTTEKLLPSGPKQETVSAR